MIGEVLESKRNMMAGQDVPDRDAEGGPRKLNEGEHGGHMKEAKRNRKIPRAVTNAPKQPSNGALSAISPRDQRALEAK